MYSKIDFFFLRKKCGQSSGCLVECLSRSNVPLEETQTRCANTLGAQFCLVNNWLKIFPLISAIEEVLVRSVH